MFNYYDYYLAQANKTNTHASTYTYVLYKKGSCLNHLQSFSIVKQNIRYVMKYQPFLFSGKEEVTDAIRSDSARTTLDAMMHVK